MRFHLTYFQGSKKLKTVVDNDTEIQEQHYVSRIRGLRDCGGPDALPGISGEFTGAILIEAPSEFPDGSHGPPGFTYLLEAKNMELIEIRQRLDSAGFKQYKTVSSGVSFALRQLDQSQKEALSLRKRINELLQHLNAKQPESQPAHSTEICLTTDGQSAEGNTSKPEG